MKNIILIINSFLICSLISCAQQIKTTSDITMDKPSAFPGAEGFGKYTTGGREGKVYIVTNLNDKGPGSFREAAEKKEKRIIVFAISGTIHLETKFSIKGDVTIAGQSAPGDGICLADNSVLIAGNNMIVRFLRFRLGDKYQNEGMVDKSGDDDAFGGNYHKNIIIDHCSMSWSDDEAFSVYGGDSTTLQWNLIAEPLNYSYHFEKGDSDYEHHGYGAIWGGRHSSFLHNLFADCNSRNPRFDGIRNISEENCDFRNNVIYNWGHNTMYAGEGGTYNVVNNYYKYGPSTNKNVRSRIANPWSKLPKIDFGKWYVNGNYVDGDKEVTEDNWKGVVLEKGTDNDLSKIKLVNPFPTPPCATESAKDAYNSVLTSVGCNLPVRDTMDLRILRNVVERTGSMIDVQGGYPHGTEYEKTVNAWPTLKSLPAPKDSDGDGMPDDWEKKNGLNANDASDAAKFTLSKSYTNIEVYINSLLK
jgi:pectate lyase